MIAQKEGDFFEISVPKFLIPAVIVLVLSLVGYAIFSFSTKEDADDGDVAGEVTFSDPEIEEASVNVELENAAYIGDIENAKYAIVEFSDYLCPFCEMFTYETFPQIKKDYLEYDDFVYFFKEVDLMSEESLFLSVLGRCVLEHEGLDKYLAYRSNAYDAFFGDYTELASLMGVSTPDVDNCYENLDYEGVIINNSAIREQAGIQGVPGFIVGKFSQDGLVEGYLIPGAFPFSMFEEVISVLTD